MKAHRSDERERVPARGRRSEPAPPPDAARLLRLNHLAGNAAVASLVVQRFELSEADRKRIKKLKDKKLAAEVEVRIKAFTDGQGGLWNMLTSFPVGTKVPERERKEYFAALYHALGRGDRFDDLFDIRQRLDRKYGETMAPAEKPGKQEVAPRFLPPGAVGFAPSAESVNTARANLKRPEEKKKPPAVWTTFPESDRRALMEMWKEWQAGKAEDFYEDIYKRSAVKQGMNVPSADEYVKALDAHGLRGGQEEAFVKKSRTGYPLELPHKGDPPRSRVYLNPSPRHVVDVYRFVKESIHPLPGVTWVKLADHALAMTVRDVIIVYISSAREHEGTEETVIGLLANYQRTAAGHFVDEVPRLTSRRLKGVGVGAEPPNQNLTVLLNEHLGRMSFDEREDLWSDPADFSFSTYRSQLVERAVKDAGGEVEKFQSLVVDYFVRAGIDPADPARHGKPDPSVVPLLGLYGK